jgi:hypothetical protein
MAKSNKPKGLSVEELKALQAKVEAGETLTADEQKALDASLKDQDTETLQEEQLDKIATLISKKLKDGNTDGGKPFVPAADEAEKAKAKTQDEVADEYFKGVDLDSFPWPGIHVTSDNQIFLGNVQGENALGNHVAANKGMTHKSYAKPQ